MWFSAGVNSSIPGFATSTWHNFGCPRSNFSKSCIIPLFVLKAVRWDCISTGNVSLIIDHELQPISQSSAKPTRSGRTFGGSWATSRHDPLFDCNVAILYGCTRSCSSSKSSFGSTSGCWSRNPKSTTVHSWGPNNLRRISTVTPNLQAASYIVIAPSCLKICRIQAAIHILNSGFRPTPPNL